MHKMSTLSRRFPLNASPRPEIAIEIYQNLKVKTSLSKWNSRIEFFDEAWAKLFSNKSISEYFSYDNVPKTIELDVDTTVVFQNIENKRAIVFKQNNNFVYILQISYNQLLNLENVANCDREHLNFNRSEEEN